MSGTPRAGRGAPSPPRVAGALFVMGLLVGCQDCLPRYEAEEVERLAYPSCGEGPLPEGEVIASGHLRAGPTMREGSVVERWEVRRRDCLYVFTVHQEWERQISDVEVVYDADWKPLRAWKRMTIPGADPDGRPDTRLYQLEDEPVSMIQRSPEGLSRHRFNGGRPVAVIGPGRALVSAWIQAHDLEVGDVVRGPVLDFRPLVEEIDEVALRRDPDREEPGLGPVRVYTVFGRESVFTDEHGWVVGDLAGLRTDESLDTPAPEPLPTYGAPNPRGTP